MSKRWQFCICLLMMVLFCGCGMDNNLKGEEEAVKISMTEEEIVLMTDVYGEEDRMRSGDLFDFHVEALQQLRAGMEYLEKKYPECGVKIVNFSPATKISPQAQFLIQGEEEASYTMALHVVDGEYVCTDDYYSVFIREVIPICKKGDIKKGEAEIISTVKNGYTERYKIEISAIDTSKEGSKCFKIKVADPTLIAITGGIVKGMSGSPIIQDGKLVGAVTHVMVANPTEGYGIFIENMLNAAQNQAIPKAA